MISLKRNSKLELVPATGRRSLSKSIYSPNQKEDFKISRGRFDNFLTCPRYNQIVNSDILHKRDFQASIFVIANKLIDQFNDNAKNFYKDLLIYDRDCRQILDHDWHKKAPGNDYIHPLHANLNGDRCMVAGQGYGANIVHISLKELKRYSLASGLLE
jgi:hypothetical protein